MKARTTIRILVRISFILILLVYPEPVFADGPSTGDRRIQLENEPAGPYLLRVVTSPTPPLIDNLYLEVRVVDASTGTVIEDASVVTSALPQNSTTPLLEEIATHDIAPNPVEYGAHLRVPSSGIWLIEVRVEGAEGNGTVSFPIQVNAPSSIGPIVAVGAPIAGLVILAAMFLWLQRNESPVDNAPN